VARCRGTVDDLQDAYLWSYYPDGDWSVHSTYL